MTVAALTRSGSGFGRNETGPAAALQPVTALVRLQIATSACLLLPFVAKRHLLPGFHVKNGSFFRIDHIKNDRCCALGLTARAWRFLQIHRPVGATGEHSTRRADRLATPCRNPRRESVVDPQRDIDERCCRAAHSTHRWRRRSEACNGQGLGPRSGRVPLNALKYPRRWALTRAARRRVSLLWVSVFVFCWCRRRRVTTRRSKTASLRNSRRWQDSTWVWEPAEFSVRALSRRVF